MAEAYAPLAKPRIEVKVNFKVKTCIRAARAAGGITRNLLRKVPGQSPASLAPRTYAWTSKVKVKIKIKTRAGLGYAPSAGRAVAPAGIQNGFVLRAVRPQS
jgi:hypothetical protein